MAGSVALYRWNDENDGKTCYDCVHYRRHYAKMGRRFGEIHDGHCVYPRVKRRAEDEVCLHFKPRAPEEDR